jgi:glycosyltransferase involved in cell wall biosynthesis
LESKPLKVIFLTIDDPLDKHSWSGIYFRMFMSLKNEKFDLIPFGPFELKFVNFLLKIFQRIVRIATKKRYDRGHSIFLSKVYGILLKRKLRNKKFDAIFAPTASSLIAHINTRIPIFYFSDATVNLLINYYNSYSDLALFSIKESNIIEQKAIDNANISIFASSWAARDAIHSYHANPGKVKVIKMGANIEDDPQVANIENKLNQKICNLLFLGVDWERKGGDIVLKTIDLLKSKGFDFRLIVSGCVPPVTRPDMTVYPFLSKDNEEEYKKFVEILGSSHFLFLPTRAECAGIVFCEASANGLPSITTDTGGVTSYVENDVNGYALPYSAEAEEYAELIIKIFNDKELYTRLFHQARKKYLEELNWNVWAKNTKRLIQETLLIRSGEIDINGG